jgi:hypothetical protein
MQKGRRDAALFIWFIKMTKLVYLDSNDFSDLSHPDKELTAENKAILSTLLAHKRTGTAKFFMSAVHLSEAVHAADVHKESAIRRAELMRELCESNILLFPTELPKLEFQMASRELKNVRLSIDEIKSSAEDWFGTYVPLDDLPQKRIHLRTEVLQLFNRGNRKERRKLRSEFDPRKPSSYEKLRQLIISGSQSSPIPYPFNLLDRDIAIDWLFGKIKDAEYRRRILTLVGDPYLLFKHLLNEPKIRQDLYEAVRKQGRDLAAQMDLSAQQIISALSPFANSEIEPRINATVEAVCSKPETLRQMISSFGFPSDDIPEDNLLPLIKFCPSALVFSEINKAIFQSRIYSYLQRMRTGNMSVKPSKDTDFGDIMHSLYAPYFDIFRCDKSIGGLLKKHKPVRQSIADRIADVPRMLSDESLKMAAT